MTLFAIDAFDVRAQGKGVSRALTNIARRLGSNAEVQYVILTTDEGARILGDLPQARVKIVPDVTGTVWEQISLPRIVSRLQAQAVYTQRECPPVWGPPVVAHIHEYPGHRWKRQRAGSVRDRLRRGYTSAAMGRGLCHAGAVLASTAATRSDLIRHFKLEPATVSVATLGVDELFFEKKTVPGERYLFHLGSADPRDNTALVLHAYAAVASRNPDVAPLRIAGGLGALQRSLEEQASTAGLRGNVEFLGRVPDLQLAELYAGATITVQPSADEGFGLQPLEAMASGSPLIAYDTPAVREVSADAAHYVDRLDRVSLADAIEALLEDDIERERMSSAGRAQAERFGWDATVATIDDALCRVANMRP